MKELLKEAFEAGEKYMVDCHNNNLKVINFEMWYNSKEVQSKLSKMQEEIIDLKIRANEKWIKNNWPPVSCLLIITGFYIVASILKWGIASTIFGIITFVILFVIILAWILDMARDEIPYQITDLRMVEGVEKFSEDELKEIYHEETNRCISMNMYLLMTPEEKHYVNWLELQATKFLILKSWNEEIKKESQNSQD